MHRVPGIRQTRWTERRAACALSRIRTQCTCSRPIRRAGTLLLHNGQEFRSQALNSELIGLEDVLDGIWNAICDEALLGRFDEYNGTVTFAHPREGPRDHAVLWRLGGVRRGAA